MSDDVIRYICGHIDETVRKCPADEGNRIGLPYPFTVPCISGKFQEMYYWDTYFTNLGLLPLGRTELAKNNADNMKSVIDRYGFMPNGTRTYFLSRSQPPFYAETVEDVFAATGDEDWLRGHIATLGKEWSFWMTKRRTDCGLNGYAGDCRVQADYDGVPLEAAIRSRVEAFRRRTGFPEEIPDGEPARHVAQGYFSIVESGLDCNFRFGTDAEWYAETDLNALLYRLEDTLARFCERLGLPQVETWQSRAQERAALINRLMWDEQRGGYYDYDWHGKKQNPHFAVTAYYTMYAGLADKKQAARLVSRLPEVECTYGISNADEGYACACQWDYPNGWAPIQYIVAAGLERYGYTADARRVMEKYVMLVRRVFAETGMLWEKYNVVTGKVATTRENITTPMLGWTAGVYAYFAHRLGEL